MLNAVKPVVSRRELPEIASKIFYKTITEAKATQQALMKKTVIMVRAAHARHFEKQRGPSGKKWRPLAHPRPGSGGKDRPLEDTGLLRRAASSDAPGNICRIKGDTLEYGVDMVQAAIQNYGGVVTPKNGKFLAIPATVEAKRTGSPRRFRRKLRAIINKAGTGGVLVEYTPKNKRRGKKWQGYKGDGNVVQYYLTKKVEIPAREFIGLSDKDIEGIQDMWVDHYWESMQRVVKRGGQ